MGIRLLREARGLVRLLPLSLRAALSFFRYRSIVAGLTRVSCSAISEVIPKAGYWAMKGICCRMNGTNLPAFIPEECPVLWRFRSFLQQFFPCRDRRGIPADMVYNYILMSIRNQSSRRFRTNTPGRGKMKTCRGRA